MKPQGIFRFKPALSILLAGILVLSGPGLGAYQAAATVFSRPVSSRSGLPSLPVNPGARTGLSQSPLRPNAITLGLTPAALTQVPVLAPGAASRALLPVLAAPADGSAPAALRTLPQAAVLTAPQLPATAPGASSSQDRSLSGALQDLRAGQEEISSTLTAEASNETASSIAGAPFVGRARVADDGVLAPEAKNRLPDAPARLKPAGLGLGLLPKLGLAGAAVSAAALLGARPWLAGVHAGLPIWNRAVDALGSIGYLSGNALAFIFALPQIHQTFKDGDHSATPMGRAVIGMAASAALGLVSAPVAGQIFWGMQNIFGGLTLIAPVVVGKLLKRHGRPLPGRAAVLWTILTSAGLLGLSFAIYAAAAALLPAALAALLGASGVSALTLALQVATGVMFLSLFVPDITAILHKQSPKGFTSLLSLLFSIASVGFIAWAVQGAVDAKPGSTQRIQYIIYAVQNAIYAVVSWISYRLGRRLERRSSSLPDASGIEDSQASWPLF